MYYLYIIESESTGRLYIGQTQGVEKRVSDHNRGGSPYTKGKGPWHLIYLKEFNNRTEALACEKNFKGWKSQVRIKTMISKGNNG
jgi:putative endonuclease